MKSELFTAMKTRSFITAVALSATLFTTSLTFAGRPGHWYCPDNFEAETPRRPHYDDGSREYERPVRSDYQPQYANAYRLGYEWGARDASYGTSRNYRRAYLASGCCYEPFFQEGYWHGFEGMPRAH